MSETDVATEEAAGTSVPDAAVVSLVDAVSHALDSTTTDDQLGGQHPLGPPPRPLPEGWILKESRSQPNYYYYYHIDTGISQWHSPVVLEEQEHGDDTPMETVHQPTDTAPKIPENTIESDTSTEKKRVLEDDTMVESAKKAKTASTSGPSKPSKVRILHILRKHKDSRRPSSWRKAKIASTKEEAREELQGLIDILQEESGEDQRATFEELARTESDCSSAKRGGDLGFFGPKKMQPAFEEASFALEIGELSEIVETSSGVHVLLRIG